MKKFFIRAEKGDTVLNISNRFSIPPITIIKLNNLKRELEEGDLLYIEDREENVYRVQVQDTIESLCEKFHIDERQLIDKNNIDYIFYGLLIYV